MLCMTPAEESSIIGEIKLLGNVIDAANTHTETMKSKDIDEVLDTVELE